MSDLHWTADESTTTEFARLSGDRNPIHLDDDAARAAGFERLVVHGMCVLGVAHQAARASVPATHVLRRMDARFSGPVFPNKLLEIPVTVSHKPDGTMRAVLKPSVGGKAVISPANFTFAPRDAPWPPPPRLSLEHDDGDVVSRSQGIGAQDLDAYKTLITPADAQVVGVPPMAGLLLMTDALALAYGNRKPPRPGAWVHLRQQGDFYREFCADQAYSCRVQESRATVRTAKVGFQVVIDFVIEEEPSGVTVASGTVTLMYLFEKDGAEEN